MSRTSTPSRYKPAPGTTETPSITVGGRVYEDEEQTRFSFRCSSMGFGLPSFDDFIDSLPDGIAKQELIDWRQQAFKAFKSGNQHALKGWLQAMYVAWRFRLTIDDIRLPLSLGLKQKHGSKANKKKAIERHEYLIKEYEYYREIGLDDIKARKKANVELKDKFEKEYGRTQLKKIIDKHLNIK